MGLGFGPIPYYSPYILDGVRAIFVKFPRQIIFLPHFSEEGRWEGGKASVARLCHRKAVVHRRCASADADVAGASSECPQPPKRRRCASAKAQDCTTVTSLRLLVRKRCLH